MRITRRALLATAAFPLAAAGPKNYAPPTPAPGAIRYKWNYGSICAANNRDPRIQVIAYNEDTLIMRENIAVHWEAPFTYLLAGRDRALLIDSGATPEPQYYPLRATVEGLLRRWASLRRIPELPLTIVHTSEEDLAQNQGVGQFKNRPNTTIVNAPTGTIDLGGRIITVIPTPGTHKDGVTFYDRYTGNLFTGDLLFPGRIMISRDTDYIASLERLEAFTATHPTQWILGGHIEMSAVPGVQYSTRTNFKPNEHVLQLERETIDEALVHARKILGQPKYSIRADYILFNRIGPDERGEWPADLPPVPVTVNLR